MLITGFIALQMIGWLGCSILLLTIIFSRKIQRHATWTNLCLAWILSGVSFSLLFLGHQMKNTPYYPLCVTQAALIYASQTLTSGASVALAIQLLFRVNSLVYSSPEISPRFHRIRCIILVASPYLAFITFFIGVLVVGLNHPDTVQKSKNGMYCHIHDQFQVPAKLTTAFMVLTMFPTVSIEGIIILGLYRNWRTYQRDNGDLLGMIIRVCCFTFFSALSVGISFVYLSQPSSISVGRIIWALDPVAFFVIFSTQRDILNTWMFWRPQPQRSHLPAKPPVLWGDTDGDPTEANSGKTFGQHV